MKSRWLLFSLCALLGVAVLTCGWIVPAYLWATDTAVLQRAGQQTPTLAERGVQLVKEDKLGAAELLLEAARMEGIAARGEFGLAVTNLAREHPGWKAWGGGDRQLESLFGAAGGQTRAPAATASVEGQTEKRRAGSDSEPLTDWIVRLENRGRVLELLTTSRRPVVRELLACRALTNTVIFSPSQSSSGQALDAAISVCGLLLAESEMAKGFSDAVFTAASSANHGGSTEPLEGLLLDVMSLGQRLNWGQLTVFVGQIEQARTFRLFGEILRMSEEQLPVLFSAVLLSGKPDAVAGYLTEFSRTGMNDLGLSLRYGSGGVQELLKRHARIYTPGLRQLIEGNTPLGALFVFAVDYAWRSPWPALAAKWFLYAASGFLFAVGLHFALPPVTELERPLQVRGFHIAREILFALGFLVVVLLLSEPFLAQEGQRAEFALRLRLPTVGSAVATGASSVKSTFMDPKSLLTLLLFFVLQALIYIACLVKLAEIRRQRVAPRMKLKLLENEDHLFDAGLYLGFAGTIVSLILVSLGVIKPSLMAAYSSTSFGIIFVSVFKIFNLRPERRRLLLAADAELPHATATSAPRPLAAQV